MGCRDVNETDIIQKLIAGKAQVKVIPGNYRGLDGVQALVDFSGGRVPVSMATAFRPEINEAVWVLVVDGTPFLLGPTVPKPYDGTIVSTAAGIAVVSTDIGLVNATYEFGATLSASQQVKLIWGNGCHVVSVISTSPVPPDVPAPPQPPESAPSQYTKLITANSSSSYQSGYGWHTSDVWSSAHNQGLWFYGSKINDTIPDTATINSAQIYLPYPLQLLGSRPFGRHAYGSRPGGAPTLSATSTLGGTSGWVSIPTSLVDWLKANTGGVGFDIGGYNIWPGTQSDGQSGALRITYTI